MSILGSYARARQLVLKFLHKNPRIMVGRIGFYYGSSSKTNAQDKFTESSFSFPRKISSKKALISFGTIVAIGTLGYELYWFKDKFKSTVPPHPELIGEKCSSSSSKYFYTNITSILGSPWYYKYLPWVSLCQAPVWFYIYQAKSDDLSVRFEAIKNIASLRGLSDTECLAIASAIDFKTAVALAHAGADPRMVLTPKVLHPETLNMCLATTFRRILDSLPPDSIHEVMWKSCISALRSFRPTEQEAHDSHLDMASGFDCELNHLSKPFRELSEDAFLKPCLQALLSHARIREQIPVILENNGMDLLLAISQRFRNDPLIMGLVIKILCSISSHPESIQSFEKSGILGLIVELSVDDDVKLSFPARKVIHNLDLENSKYILPPGIYQLYPDYRMDENKLIVDVVFIHGIMGGAFRTWRSQDMDAVWRFTRVDSSNKYSLCDSQPLSFKEKISIVRDKILGPPTYKDPNVIIDESPTPPKPSSSKCALDDENNKSYLRRRLDQIRNRLFRKDPDIIPINREIRDGEMYYFPADTDIPLETEVLSDDVPKTNCWPRDWLPTDIDNIRVLAADFDTFITHWNPVMPVESLGRTISERSNELIDKLVIAGVGNRPIVWVTHSAGGVIVKQLLELAETSEDPEERKLAKATGAVVFCSTPHFGSRMAGLGTKGQSIFLPTVEILELTKDSDELKRIDDSFQKLMSQYKYFVVSFGELCPTIGSVGVSAKLVTVDSSDPGYGEFYGLKVDHLNICKPRSKKSFVYLKVKEVIQNVVKSVAVPASKPKGNLTEKNKSNDSKMKLIDENSETDRNTENKSPVTAAQSKPKLNDKSDCPKK